MPSSPLVAVIVLTVNQREKTLRCLESLLDQRGTPFQALLWDNGSQDGTIAAVQADFPNVTVHRHPDNLGVASGRNAAAQLAIRTVNPSYLLFLDNDMVLEPDFVTSLLQPLLQDSRVGQTQAKLLLMDDPQRLNDGGGCRIGFLSGRTRAVGFGEIDRGQYDFVRSCVCGGGAMMVRTDVFQSLRGFDPAFDPFGPEDIDFSLRLRRAGYEALFVPQAIAYHEASHSYGNEYDAAYARLRARHWLIFSSRHAPRWQRLVFMGVTAPLLFLKILTREAIRGNFTAIPGLIKGAAETVRQPGATAEPASWRPGRSRNESGTDEGDEG